MESKIQIIKKIVSCALKYINSRSKERDVLHKAFGWDGIITLDQSNSLFVGVKFVNSCIDNKLVSLNGDILNEQSLIEFFDYSLASNAVMTLNNSVVYTMLNSRNVTREEFDAIIKSSDYNPPSVGS